MEDALIEPAVQSALRQLVGDRARFDEPMSRHTSLQVGGSADAYVRPRSIEDLCRVLALCRDFGLPWQVLGKGFNTLVLDGGLRGVTLSLGLMRDIAVMGDCVIAEAGVTHSALARFCAERGRAGMEFAVGIPGTVGGWLRMNAGTREREVAQVAESVELLLEGAERAERYDATRLTWRYRALELPANSIIVGGSFRTHADGEAAIRERMDTQLAQRRRTQPVNERSFGSVFKNPDGDHAGRLIEAAELKGESVGDAAISTLHANFIVNRGHARASDVLALIERAQTTVARSFGIALETEVHVVGDPA